MADPTLRAILARLAEGQATVVQITEPFDISQSVLSRHLKVLDRWLSLFRAR
ncbi:MAG: ArsR family transcriptional regulator [Hyphomicrobiales bacterium]